MNAETAKPETGADALLLSLSRLGVTYLFANAGTDFPPLIEGLAKLPATEIPTPLTIPHETVAVGMAHGYWLVTGEAQAVMVHVNVGLANSVMGVINAASDNVPVILLSGRTPLTETGREGGRVTPIQYAQEMFDQAGLVRGAVKYDYEIRYPEQADSVMVRAVSIARSTPCGPVYMSLPREPLCEALPGDFAPAPASPPATLGAPTSEDVDRLSSWIDAAEMPLIICQRGDPEGQLSPILSSVARSIGIGVIEPFLVRNVLGGDDPALIGYTPEAVAMADLILVLDAGVPWIERREKPGGAARVVHIGPDPLFSDRPVRGFQSDLNIVADPARTLHALAEKATPNPKRRAYIEGLSRARRDSAEAGLLPPAKGAAASPAWFSRAVSDIMSDDAVAFSELGLLPGFMRLKGPNRLFSNPHSGGLGWGLPAALGAQLADRKRLVIAAIGDGSYMFANPVACHQVAEAMRLPVLTIVKNNAGWNAVRRAVRGAYPHGAAMARNEIPLTSLEPLPDFADIARASRAHAERIEDASELPAALARAVDVIRHERRQVLLDVSVTATDTF